MRRGFGVLRLAMAAFGVVALIARLIYSLGFSGPVVANFVSYFTMESAFAAIVFWTIGGWVAVRDRPDPGWLPAARLLATTYQIISGVGFTIIVVEAGQHGYYMVVPWSSVVLHYVLPVYGAADWLASRGPGPLPWRTLRLVAVYPLAWGAYTLIRGAFIGWYPYFFLDPAQVTIPEMVAYSAGALIVIVAIAVGLIAANRTLPPSRGRLGEP